MISYLCEQQLQSIGQEVFIPYLAILLLPETNPGELRGEGEWCLKGAGAFWMQVNYSGNFRCT